MRQYDELIKTTIRRNNDDIYNDLLQFLAPAKMGIENSNVKFDPDTKGLTIQGISGSGVGPGGLVADCNSQIPTCLVVTSNESVSSIETQFAAMCAEMKAKINSINLILDEKKCQTLKAAIEHIQSKLKDAIGLDQHEQFGYSKRVESEAEESGDEVKIRIPEKDSSDEEDEFIENNIMSSNHVSTLKQTTFFEDSSRPNKRETLESAPGLVLNENMMGGTSNNADPDHGAENDDELKDNRDKL